VKPKLITRAIPTLVVSLANVVLIPFMQFYKGGPSVTDLKNQNNPGVQTPLQAKSASRVLIKLIISVEI